MILGLSSVCHVPYTVVILLRLCIWSNRSCVNTGTNIYALVKESLKEFTLITKSFFFSFLPFSFPFLSFLSFSFQSFFSFLFFSFLFFFFSFLFFTVFTFLFFPFLSFPFLSFYFLFCPFLFLFFSLLVFFLFWFLYVVRVLSLTDWCFSFFNAVLFYYC